MTKIKIAAIVLKKEGTSGDGKAYKIYEITDDKGKKYDTFDYLEPDQEFEGEVKENANPAYNAKFMPKKENKAGGGNKFPPKDYTFEKKKVALECAVSLVAAGKVESKSLTECRDKFYQYLNEK